MLGLDVLCQLWRCWKINGFPSLLQPLHHWRMQPIFFKPSTKHQICCYGEFLKHTTKVNRVMKWSLIWFSRSAFVKVSFLTSSNACSPSFSSEQLSVRESTFFGAIPYPQTRQAYGCMTLEPASSLGGLQYQFRPVVNGREGQRSKICWINSGKYMIWWCQAWIQDIGNTGKVRKKYVFWYAKIRPFYGKIRPFYAVRVRYGCGTGLVRTLYVQNTYFPISSIWSLNHAYIF